MADDKQTSSDVNKKHDLKGRLVCVMCANYIYSGILVEETYDKIILKNPEIVYRTGPWNSENWERSEKLPTDFAQIERSAKESMFEVKREKAK